MRSSRGIWIVFVVLGMAWWLSSVGFWSHPVYRMALALGTLTWAGYAMWVPARS